MTVFPVYVTMFPVYVTVFPVYVTMFPVYVTMFPVYVTVFPVSVSMSSHFPERIEIQPTESPLRGAGRRVETWDCAVRRRSGTVGLYEQSCMSDV